MQVVAYEVLRAATSDLGPSAPDLAPAGELEALYARILRLMGDAGFRFRQDDPETFLASVRRCFGRAAFERRDLRTMHLILATVERLARQVDGARRPRNPLAHPHPLRLALVRLRHRLDHVEELLADLQVGDAVIGADQLLFKIHAG